MAYQNRENLAYATVAVAPSPATSGTSLTVANGLGSLFPTSNFQITVYPPGVEPLASNAEICTVSSRTGDVFTIVRAQEGTTARSIATGWQVSNTITKRAFTDIQDSIIQSVAAGGVSITAPLVIFSNSNNVSFGAAGSVITASVDTGSGGGGGVAISAGGNSQGTGTIEFSNSNGVSFGLDGAGVMTASHNGLTSQSNQAFSAQGGSSTFQTLGFSNANGVSFSNSNGSVVASHNGISIVGLSGGTQSNGVTAIVFRNSNGVSFGVNGSTVTASVAVPAAGSINFSAGTTSNNATNIVFSNANGVSFGLDGSTITASIPAGAAPGSISAGTTSVALGQAVFSNSNGITFGLDGSTVTAAHNGLTSQSNQAASADNGSFAFQTISFSNANGISFITSAGSAIAASHNALTSQSNQAASASNGSFTFQTLGFSNANNVTFGTSAGSIITASVATQAAGGGATLLQWTSPLFASAGSFATSLSQNQPYFDKVNLSCPISFSVIRQIGSFNGQAASSNAATTAQHAVTIEFAVYSRSVTDSGATNFSDSTNLVTHLTASALHQVSAEASSQSHTMTWVWQSDSTGGTASSSNSTVSAGAWAPAQATGQKAINIFVNASLSAGEWWFAQKNSSSTAGYAAASSLIRQTNYVALQMSNASFASGFGMASAADVMAYPGFGVYTVTTAALPTTLNSTEIRNINFSVNQRIFQAMA